MTKREIGAFPASGSGSRASHEAAKASSPKASVPNAEQADFLGWLLDWMDDRPLTATQRAVIIVGSWEALKSYPAEEVVNHD